ncbi:MAG: SPOR domain-containing protein [Bacteroidia bacterium]|nr:SPOR domain-containing protein [Bacteroidia bacterium]
MQPVEKHISNLLYDHDCVIVPNLGGFVANYASAKINSNNHTFQPPSKSIVFNKNITSNDGLLAHHIAVSENKNYPDALNQVFVFSDNTNAALKKGAKVKIDDVGTLFLDVERNIQFEPSTTNFLLDAFGLNDFHSPAIKRDTISKRIEKEFKDREAIPAERKKTNVKRLVALTIAIPIIAALIWVPLKTDFLKNVNYSNLNPFSKTEKASKHEVNVYPTITELKKDTLKNIIPANTEPATASLVEPVKADTTEVVLNTQINASDFKFHVVAGCFKIQENATNFVQQLKEQNINATIIGQNKDGLFVVSCGDFATRKQATDELQTIRQSQPNAWLYKN